MTRQEQTQEQIHQIAFNKKLKTLAIKAQALNAFLFIVGLTLAYFLATYNMSGFTYFTVIFLLFVIQRTSQNYALSFHVDNTQSIIAASITSISSSMILYSLIIKVIFFIINLF